MKPECEHKKWSKWIQGRGVAGVTIQTRKCKRCGWSETKSTKIWCPYEFKKAFKEIIEEVIKDMKGEQNETISN